MRWAEARTELIKGGLQAIFTGAAATHARLLDVLKVMVGLRVLDLALQLHHLLHQTLERRWNAWALRARGTPRWNAVGTPLARRSNAAARRSKTPVIVR